jgi:hypothetical protein
VGCKNSSRHSSVHFSSSLRFGTERASSLSESKSAVGRSKSSGERKKHTKNNHCLVRDDTVGCWEVRSARTMTKVFLPPLIVYEVQQLRRLVQMCDQAAILHISREPAKEK